MKQNQSVKPFSPNDHMVVSHHHLDIEKCKNPSVHSTSGLSRRYEFDNEENIAVAIPQRKRDAIGYPRITKKQANKGKITNYLCMKPVIGCSQRCETITFYKIKK